MPAWGGQSWGSQSSSWGANGDKWQKEKRSGEAPAPEQPKVQLLITSPKTPAAEAGVKGAPAAAFRVTTVTKKDDLVATTLVGDYVEIGMNHERKYYKKSQEIEGHPNVNVFLYYWDARDGAEFSGWWFGDELGGTQVWSRSAVHTQTPPKAGWRIPWDADSAEVGALIVEPMQALRPAVAAASLRPVKVESTKPARPAAPISLSITSAASSSSSTVTPAQRLKKATDEVAAAEASCNAAAALVKRTLAMPSPSDVALKQALEAIQKQQQALMELQGSLTKDVAEARKGGASATAQVTELSKLSPRIKTLQANLVADVSKVKAQQVKATSEKTKAETEKKKKEAEEAKKKQDEKNLDEFKQQLPGIKEAADAIAKAVDAIAAKAAPLVANPPPSGALDKELAAIEKMAADAQKRVIDHRTDVTSRLAKAKAFPAEDQKAAIAELNKLQTQVNEAQRKVNPYKNFKKEFAARVEARKAIVGILDKFDAAERDISKASGIAMVGSGGQLSQEEITESDTLTKAASLALSGALSLVNQKARGADAAMQAELETLKTRHAELRKALEGVSKQMTNHREAANAQKIIEQAREKAAKVEDAMDKCAEAEMPFLKGIEVLPKDESEKAISDSEAAARKASTIVNEAKSFLKLKLAESKKYTKELEQSVSDQLVVAVSRVDAADAKLTTFKKETSERKTSALLAEVVEAVNNAERKVAALKDCATALEKDEAPSAEGIKAHIEKAATAAKDAAHACEQAQRIVKLKQSAAKGGDAAGALSKLAERLSTAQVDLKNHKISMDSAQKGLRIKLVLTEQGGKIAEAESQIRKAEKIAKESAFTEALVKALDEALKSAIAILTAVPGAVQPLLAIAPAESKAKLQALLDERSRNSTKLDSLKASTKDKREQALASAFESQGEAKVAALEEAVEKMGDAELPFLKGIEVLPFLEAKSAIEASEEAVAVATEALSTARTYVASTALMVKSFGKDIYAVISKKLSALDSRVKAAAEKLTEFKEETVERKKNMQVQDAEHRVGMAEEQAKTVNAAAEPFLQDGADKLSEDAAAEPLKIFLAADEEVKKLIADARTLISDRLKHSKDNAKHMALLSKLQARINAVQESLTMARKATATHEQRFLAKRVVQEVKDKLATLDGEVQSATEACAPLVGEEAGERFLLLASIKSVAKALEAHLQAQKEKPASLFQKASKGKKLNEVAFIKYLEGLPEAIGHPEVELTEERRRAIFKHLDADKDGVLSSAEFHGIFFERAIVKKGVSLTDGSVVEGSKTVGKVEPGDELEILGPTVEDEAGMLRCEVKSNGKKGWMTVRGNQGTFYIEVKSAFVEFCKSMDKAIADAAANIQKVNLFISEKFKETAAGVPGAALSEARGEISKSRTQVSEATARLEALKKQVVAAKKDFAAKEKDERNAHIFAKEKKEAQAITEKAESCAASAVTACNAVEERAKAFMAVEDAELEAFKNPLAVLQDVTRLAGAASEAAETARKVMKEQLQVANAIKPPSGSTAEAKRQLNLMSGKVEQGAKAVLKALETVRAKCVIITDRLREPVAAALRKQAQKEGVTVAALFGKMAKGKLELSGDAFCKALASLKDLSLKPDDARLLFSHIAGDSLRTELAQREFLAFAQRYCVVIKDIAMTDAFDVNAAKTLRKVEKDEHLEISEGPVADPKTGLQRVRARALLDGLQGWVSFCGNQGTIFMKDIDKQFYTVRGEVSLEDSLGCGATTIRSLVEDEVLELVEGPRTEVFPPTQRCKVKTNKDGALGWVTIRDKHQVVYCEPNDKLYTCIASVAMTDGGDIMTCKVMRKLAAGELFETVGSVVEDEESSVQRVEGKALKDGLVGWITTQGNAGTIYAEPSKLYSVVKEVSLEKRFPATSQVEQVRRLDVGETLQLVEGPMEEKVSPEVRVKVRALSDGSIGWISKSPKVKSWSRVYKCVSKVPLRDSRAADKAKELRGLQMGEVVELLDGPHADGQTTYMRCRALKDDLVGWVTLRDETGKRYVDC